MLGVEQEPILQVDEDGQTNMKLERPSLLTRKVLPGVALLAFLALVGFMAYGSQRHVPKLALATTSVGKNRFLSEVSDERVCLEYPGLKLAESSAMSLWATCSKKWSEDCTNSGCCADAGMACYEKSSDWAACKSGCDLVDERNETWSCRKVEPILPHTYKSCLDACKEDTSCQQVVYDTSAGGSCSISTDRHSFVVWAADNFNSSYCGTVAEVDVMKSMLQQVGGQLPFQLPQMKVDNCSWGGEDCSQTKCCNDVACDAHFTACFPYSCYKKTEYFSGCRLDQPPAEWDGTWLGGGRVHRQISPAGAQVSLQETSLYCFSVINWQAPAPKPFWSTEAQLADNMKTHGVSIFQCDGHDFYDGVMTPKAAWGSFSNIDAFVQVWDQVKAKGAYKSYAWTVKVDADAVFLPSRLKMHLDKLRTPRGAKVYLENNYYQFKFMGALEVMTREALDVFFEKGHTCLRGTHEGGEDFFMKGCMDALGVDHQTDLELLKDKYAAQDGTCTDGWAVAYHFHKKIISWNWCYNEVVCGGRAKTCPAGIDVEFVMPWAPNPAVLPS
mmetsp:Transcript_72213/g.234551  ORF Transcript_72213/g.234551 Transcript_72213/m.234551 type:complete len:556 (+) Transcript_72213:209-1876(+)